MGDVFKDRTAIDKGPNQRHSFEFVFQQERELPLGQIRAEPRATNPIMPVEGVHLDAKVKGKSKFGFGPMIYRFVVIENGG